MGVQFKPFQNLSNLFGKISPKKSDKTPLPKQPGAEGTPNGLAARTSSSSSIPPRAALPPSQAPKLPELKPLTALPDFSTWQLGDSRPQPGAEAVERGPHEPAEVKGPAVPVRHSTLQRKNALIRNSSGPSLASRRQQAAPGADGPPQENHLPRRRSEPTLPSTAAARSRIMAGTTSIADVLSSASPVDVGMTKQIFAEQFQNKEGWHAKFEQQLHGSVSDTLKDTKDWNTGTFQALFMAAWATKPTEKGSYMIDLTGLDGQQLEAIATAQREHCASRASSHLSGNGFSASNGYEFLNGYKELLVQLESSNGKNYLFLKTEGHTTGLSGVVAHGKSYVNKMKTGEGLTASPYLNALAKASPDLVEGRAAENYAKNYGKLLKGLGLETKSGTVTTQQMAEKLFAATNFKPEGQTAKAFVDQASNEQLGKILMAYCDQASGQPPGAKLRRMGDQPISSEMLSDLRGVAQSLIDDGPTRHGRIHREVILSPQQLDQTLKKFE